MSGISELLLEAIDKLTIEQILQGLIEDSDLVEVVSTLDVIARKRGLHIALFEGDGYYKRTYPVEVK